MSRKKKARSPAEVVRLRKKGHTYREIMRRTGYSESMVYKTLLRAGLVEERK